jgi:hypothetical protein
VAHTNGRAIFLTDGIFLVNGDKTKGPKGTFYYLWDQNEKWKLIRGPMDQISL